MQLPLLHQYTAPHTAQRGAFMRLVSRKARPLILATAIAATGLLAAAGLAATGAAATAAPAASAVPADSTSAPSLCPDAVTATFGPYVCVFTPSLTQAQIQADLDAISTQQVPVSAQFDSSRYTLFFEPGTYGSKTTPLVFQVGYYTQVAGLGAT